MDELGIRMVGDVEQVEVSGEPAGVMRVNDEPVY
jgi:hypothetical protein